MGLLLLLLVICIVLLVDAMPTFRQKAVFSGTTNIVGKTVQGFGTRGFFYNISNAASFHAYASCAQKEGAQTLSERHGCELAMNGGPFVYPQWSGPFCLGRIVSDSNVVWNNASTNDDFALTRDGYWSFGAHTSAQVLSGNYTQLMTGFAVLVKGGVVLAGAGGKVAPRTVIGTDLEGHLLMFEIDGAEKSKIGVTLGQAGQWFAQLGAWNAVNFDGGGSSTTVFQDHVVNCPTCVDYNFCCVREVPTLLCVRK